MEWCCACTCVCVQICFQKGDLITVTQIVDGGWWEGTSRGVTGWFPSNYVQEVKGVIGQYKGSCNINEQLVFYKSDLLSSKRGINHVYFKFKKILCAITCCKCESEITFSVVQWYFCVYIGTTLSYFCVYLMCSEQSLSSFLLFAGNIGHPISANHTDQKSVDQSSRVPTNTVVEQIASIAAVKNAFGSQC